MKLQMRASALAAMAAMAAPAWAELPPEYYDRARSQADSVIVMQIDQADRLEKGSKQGTCTVRGTITEVERGSAYRPGDKAAIDLPCVSDQWRPMPGPFPGYLDRGLARGLTGRFFLRAGQLVRRGYDQLTER